ncbi:hypothetical protein [Snuella sedimenti]|uniref:Uncharacterized protein n=1 Tax=Snuella sedimenti TaxID=2798802 RepID=A0A8J7IV21_9FLAO|nr:hypothetical protein [Snuella sedimenti]MBJ6367315.1 hypothetical protein [Snuella sedimenti]
MTKLLSRFKENIRFISLDTKFEGTYQEYYSRRLSRIVSDYIHVVLEENNTLPYPKLDEEIFELLSYGMSTYPEWRKKHFR